MKGADMNRRRVREEWVGRRVVLIPLDERGASGYQLHGWLRSIDDGDLFAKQFYSDSLRTLSTRLSPALPRRLGAWKARG